MRVVPGNIYGPVTPYYDNWHIDNLIVENSVVSHDGAATFCAGQSPVREFVVNSVGADGHMLLTDDSAGRLVVAQLGAGFPLWKGDLTKWGKVRRITWTGTRHRIEGEWPVGGAEAGEIWKYSNVRKMRVTGTTWQGGVRRPYRFIRAFDQVPDGDGLTKLRLAEWFPIPAAAASDRIDIVGHVHRIRVTVLEPYTGSGVSPRVVVSRYTPGWVTLISYPLNIAGFCETRTSGTDASPPATTLVQLSKDQITEGVLIEYYDLTGTMSQMPKFEIEVDAIPVVT
jgi:hypothetical protein